MRYELRRKRLRWLPGAVVLLLLLGSPGSALAKKPGVNPKPTVMLLLDSSASMQDALGAVETGILPDCHDTRVDGFSYSRSRWAVAVETLTGSFHDYWCSYDDRLGDPSSEDYAAKPLHVELKGVPVEGKLQRVDGLIDIYRDQFKFGLMTFDSYAATSDDAAGGYSYGPSKTGGMTSNFGARSENAPMGRLVSPPVSDKVKDLREVNDIVQEQILGVRPYFASPFSPLFEDALYFFKTDERVRPYSEGSEKGDPYYDCRSKSIIFVTDGLPLVGVEGQNGYPTSVAAAAELLAAGITVYVIGFDLPGGTFPVLNEIAEAGGSVEAYIADSQSELTKVLGEILVSIQGNQTSSVNTVITNRTLRSKDKQYQFNASYSGTMYTPLDQTGHLDQFVYRCDKSCEAEGADGGASLCEVYSLSGALANRTTDRVVETQINGEKVEFSILNTDVTSDMLGIPSSGVLPQLDPYELPSGEYIYSGVDLDGTADDLLVRNEYRRQLLRLVRGDEGSRRENVPMGAINNSQPVVQTNLASIVAPIPSFIQYRNKPEIRTRPTALFVGTHDGQMHAFRVDRLSTLSPNSYGEELWSFIPKTLLPKLNQLASGTVYLMDGEPVTEDVRLYKESLDLSLDEETDRWRSVLISGYGQGGRGYFALNVTQPEEYEFMWEVSEAERCYDLPGAGNGCVPSTEFERLGNTFSRPAIGSLFFEYDAVNQERSVAIFGGGGAISGEPESGKSVYVVDLQSGQVIREFCNSCGNVVDTNDVAKNTEFIDCPMIGDVVAYDIFPGAHVTRAFIGDSCGQLWRLNLADHDPEEWKLEFFHDAFDKKLDHHKRRPIALEPAAATSFNPGRLVIVYSTGSADEALHPNQRDYIYSLSEYFDGDGFVAKENWRLKLEKGETLSASPLIFNSVAYFGTQVSSSGLCAIGDSRLWGVDFDGEPTEKNPDKNVVAALDEDGNPMTIDLEKFIVLENSELLGLAVTQRPTCFAEGGESEPWLSDLKDGATTPGFGSPFPGPDVGTGGAPFGGGSGGSLELVIQTGTTGDSSPDMNPPAGGGVIETGSKAVQKLGAPAQSVFSTSWGMVFD